MATFKSNSYEGRYLQLTITETVDAKDNSSQLSWKLETLGGSSSYYYVDATTVTINGEVVYSKGKTSWSDKVFPAAKGSVSGTLTVKHGSDGKKTIDVGFSTRVYYVGAQEFGGTMKLTDIDRTAPTVSFVVSNITTNSFNILATASTKCDRWYYSLDNGSTWTSYSTTDGIAASKTITGLNVNTSYKVKVKARRTYNHVQGTSSAVNVKTLGHAILNSCAAFYVDTATVNFYPNVTVYEAGFTEYVIFKDGSTEVARSAGYKWSAGTANRTITMAASKKNLILQAMPNAEKTFTLVVETYDGSTLIGTSSCSVTVKTSKEDSGPQWVEPYISWEDTSSCAEVTGDSTIMIQGYSNLVVTALGVTARNYAKLSSYTVTIGDKSVKASTPEVNVGKIETDGELTMKLTVTDSRGHSAYVTRKVKVLKYAPPKISKITLRRANGIDDVIQLSFTASMSVIKPDGETDVNRLVNASYRYKLTSAGDTIDDYSDTVPFTDQVVRSANGTSLSFQTNQLLSLDNKNSFDFRLVVKDRVGSSVTYYVIPKGIPALAIRKEKVGVNNPDPQYALDVSGDIGLTGGLYKGGRDVIGDTGWIDLGLSDKVSTTDSANAGHYNGCAYRVVGGNHVYVAFNVRAVYSGSSVTVSGTAIPTKYRPKMQPYGIVTLNGSRVARILVSRTNGHAIIDWIRNVSDEAEPAEHTATWIDGYIDYWLD